MHQLCLNLNGLPRNGSDEIEYYLGMQATYSDILSDFSCISTIKILIVVVVVWTPLSASLLVKARCLDSSVSLLLAVSGEASFFPVLKLLIPVSCTLFLSQYPAFSPSQGLWYLWSLRPGFLCVWYCLWGNHRALGGVWAAWWSSEGTFTVSGSLRLGASGGSLTYGGLFLISVSHHRLDGNKEFQLLFHLHCTHIQLFSLLHLCYCYVLST